MSTRVIIKNVRFSYAHVFQKDNNDKYSVSILIRKDNPQVAEIKKAIEEAAREGAGKLGGNFKLNILKTLHDGDLEKAGDPAYEGCYYLNAKSGQRPGVVKVNYTGVGGKTTDITDEEEFYSGCYGMASVTFFAFNSASNKGIGCGLNNVLKTKDGEKLGGGATAESDFGDQVDTDIPEDEFAE